MATDNLKQMFYYFRDRLDKDPYNKAASNVVWAAIIDYGISHPP